MKQFITEAKRMQKLAGIINENRKWDHNEGSIRWFNSPTHPEDALYDYESHENLTKAEFWDTSIKGRDFYSTEPNYGSEKEGKWTFSWDSGEIGGFVEGEDFEFININAKNIPISSDEVEDFGEFDANTNTFEVESGSDAMGDWYGSVSGNDNWFEDEDLVDQLSPIFRKTLEDAIRNKYGADVDINYY